MDDLISRQAALTKLENALWGKEWDKVLAKTILEKLPTAEKKGKWVDGQCSNCGCDVPAYIIDWKWQKDMNANYCPICGSRNIEKMDGGEE